MSETISNRRWYVLLAAVLLQMCLGGIYAWSIFVPSLQNELGLTMRESQSIFGGCVLIFSITMIFAGKILPRTGPRVLAGTGAVLYACGYSIASMATDSGGLLFGIAFVSGIGIGLAYVCPIFTCMKWFPDNKGLVTGMTVAGFGAGAIVLSNLAAVLFSAGWGVLNVFRLIGIVYGLVILTAAWFLAMPPEPKHHTAKIRPLLPKSKAVFRNPLFWLLTLGIFCGTFAGLVVIGALELIGELWKMPHAVAVGSISALAIGNGLGRIFWGLIFDRSGMKALPRSLFFLAAAMLFFLVGGRNPNIFLLGALLIGFGFGACFVVYAGAVAHVFGTDRVPRIYPFIFLGYGISAVIGPYLGGAFYDMWKSYYIILIISTALPLAAGVFIGLPKFRLLKY